MGDLTELVKALGPSAGVVLVVWMFMRYLHTYGAKAEAESKDRREFIKGLSAECHASQMANTKKMSEVLEQCARAHDSNTVMLDRVNQTLIRLDKQNQ